jgi:hypothetical protein
LQGVDAIGGRVMAIALEQQLGAWLEGAHATARRRLNRTRDAFGPGTAIATSDPKTSWAKQQVRQWS